MTCAISKRTSGDFWMRLQKTGRRARIEWPFRQSITSLVAELGKDTKKEHRKHQKTSNFRWWRIHCVALSIYSWVLKKSTIPLQVEPIVQLLVRLVSKDFNGLRFRIHYLSFMTSLQPKYMLEIARLNCAYVPIPHQIKSPRHIWGPLQRCRSLRFLNLFSFSL